MRIELKHDTQCVPAAAPAGLPLSLLLNPQASVDTLSPVASACAQTKNYASNAAGRSSPG
eukprot:scaffold128259_cov22-Tisochrysis_lutea.AAC.3